MRGDGAHDGLLVEGPQVLERAAAAGDDDDVHGEARGRVRPAAEAAQRPHDGLLGARALDLAGAHDDARQGPAARDDAVHVVEDRAGQRGDDADAARPARQGPLARGVEEAFRREASLERLEAQGQVAHAGRLQALHVELVGALRLEDVQPAVGDDAEAGARLEGQGQAVVSEDHAAQLGALVLQREVAVPSRADRDLSDLTLDPDPGQPGRAADGVADEAREVAHGEHARPGGRRARAGSSARTEAGGSSHSPGMAVRAPRVAGRLEGGPAWRSGRSPRRG